MNEVVVTQRVPVELRACFMCVHFTEECDYRLRSPAPTCVDFKFHGRPIMGIAYLKAKEDGKK